MRGGLKQKQQERSKERKEDFIQNSKVKGGKINVKRKFTERNTKAEIIRRET